ncbi:hypothetical protein PVBG_02707 [Plasmodium vivax Brazil I]|uniref:Uncharacterized protein n=1 Tax=Plasmodium vivax (strain Brazil I) TaxID=1033975 RepID=A0A0J9SUY7_PLAV1|nr:hypothetical protein PVBG_02707 [Plasmodium vivax Brazil I]
MNCVVLKIIGLTRRNKSYKNGKNGKNSKMGKTLKMVKIPRNNKVKKCTQRNIGTFENPINNKHKITDGADLMRRRLLSRRVVHVNKGVQVDQDLVLPGVNKNLKNKKKAKFLYIYKRRSRKKKEEKLSSDKKSESKKYIEPPPRKEELRLNFSGDDTESNARPKRRKGFIYKTWKKIDRHFENRVYRNFDYISNLQKDPNMDKKMFLKILFKKYRMFVLMPFITKLFGLLVFILRATKVLESVDIAKNILLGANILISHVFSIFSVLTLIYILVKKIQYERKLQRKYKYTCNCSCNGSIHL